LVNAAVSPQTRFESSARSMFDATRAMRDLGVEVLAIYHSHPAGGVKPSRTDLEWAYGGGVANVIVAPEAIGVWWYAGDSYTAMEWRVV